MPKNKKPVPRKSAAPVEEDADEAQVAALCTLALELAEQEDSDTLGDALRQKEFDFQRLLRRYLNQNRDDVLYGAIDQASHEDIGAFQMLRGAIEEAAASVPIRRENAPALEIDVFAIPVFVGSTGGLVETEGFQDDAAYDALLDSMKSAGLESPKARLVLLRHAFDAAEASRITYSQLHTMAREASAMLGNKKVIDAPALERSITGWIGATFGPDDTAVELRFLVGFSQKHADDPFYVPPAGEQAAEDWFEARMERYRRWTEDAAPLVQRLLAPAGRALQLNFLYQDLFFGARAQGLAEQAMLALMATLGAALAEHDGPARAVIGPADVKGDMVLRVQVYGNGNLLATGERPLELGSDLAVEVDDVRDALATLGIDDVAVAARFDAQGNPVDPQPLD
ncbi:hypothetical protein GJV26_17210 [Massilia dura]|uniref:DUF2863 family protein n=1 Tax=Pseudoduganella dura TaxID=321982 RepID=A0A6I3XIF0_9BURK|nr:hypothetical protein [Pseudoduganella dura]MUI14183.1 hypothetical protein [Pseudoduganella dura]GGX76605.1 hypothetical protein GCM10007386_04590 [Pseudoduganella dura]